MRIVILFMILLYSTSKRNHWIVNHHGNSKILESMIYHLNSTTGLIYEHESIIENLQTGIRYNAEHKLPEPVPIPAQVLVSFSEYGEKLCEDLMEKFECISPLKATSYLNSTFMLNKLLEYDEIISIEIMPRFELYNKWVIPIVDSGVRNLKDIFYQNKDGLQIWKYGLNGENEIIGMGDSGLDFNSCFFWDPLNPTPTFTKFSNRIPDILDPLKHRKIAQYVKFKSVNEESEKHGTQVAGTLLGSYKGSVFNGVASESRVAFFDIGDDGEGRVSVPGDLETLYFPWAYNIGSRVHSNSWGASSSFYSSAMRDVDAFSWKHPEFLAIFSAGNGGQVQSIVSPGAAKNALTVGASMNSPEMSKQVFCSGGLSPKQSFCSVSRSQSKYLDINSLAVFSSQGPTFDGRIKPDVVSPGMFIYSADVQDCAKTPKPKLAASLGTSLSVPSVSGSVALIRQYLRSGYSFQGILEETKGFIASGALLKAMIIHSTYWMDGYVDMGRSTLAFKYSKIDSPQPNNFQGYGRIQLNRVLRFANDSNFKLLISGAIEGKYDPPVFVRADSSHKYRICILGNVSEVRLTMVWMDYPSVQGTKTSTLVNDLDMFVTRAFNGTTISTYHGNNRKSSDNVNNVEKIWFQSKFKETVDVTIKPISLNKSPQPYALVITGKLNSVESNMPCNFSMKWNEVESDLKLEREEHQHLKNDFIMLVVFLSMGVVLSTVFFICIWKCIRKNYREEQILEA